MYEKHFSFKCKPFELVPNPDFLFPSTTHKKAISYLDYGIKAKVGFILLSGDVGSGKTTIIRNFIKNLAGSIKLSRINFTKVSSEQLIAMINKDFGLSVDGKSKITLLGDLNEFLINQYAIGIQPVLLVDEAQNLSPGLLEEIRLLSNLETDRAKLLQIILVGQPELKSALMLPELMQLRQRINVNYHITALSLDETNQYIKHRLTIAGNPEAISLTDDLLEIVYSFSRGIPRLVNILCDFALLSAFVKGETVLGFTILKEIAKDLDSNDYWNESRDSSVSREADSENEMSNTKKIDEIALRMSRLEEAVKNNMSDNDLLRDKINKLEDGIMRMYRGYFQKIRTL